MANAFASLDGLRLVWILNETVDRLKFLECITREDDTSSELAGYEINKLLNEQMQLEERYAELLKVRGTLKGISNKRKLEECEKEVDTVAIALQESTKKLGRLFRENPDLKKEAEKVVNERTHLITKLNNVLVPLQQTPPTLLPCQDNLIMELNDQDSLRQLIIKEKKLLGEIKDLHQSLKNEEQSYQNEIQEKQSNVQTRKENLEKSRSDAEVELRNAKAAAEAEKEKNRRLQEQKINDLEADIEKIKEKRETEIQVFGKISSFLKQKASRMAEETAGWRNKDEETRINKQEQIDKLNEYKMRATEELRKLREEYEVRHGARVEKEKRQIAKEEEKRRKLEEDERLDDAIKKIQENYRVWKANGGTVKKKKKGKGGKKKGKK